MFLRVEYHKGEDDFKGVALINTDHVVMSDGPLILFSEGTTIYLTPESESDFLSAVLPKKRAKKSDEPTGPKAELFHTLNRLTGGSSRVVFSKAMQSKLNARLNDGISVDDLTEAARKLGQDPWWQGDNDKGVRYGTIEWLLRNSENVQKALEIKLQKKGGMFNG